MLINLVCRIIVTFFFFTFKTTTNDDIGDNTQVAQCENVVEAGRFLDSQSQNGYNIENKNRNEFLKLKGVKTQCTRMRITDLSR